MNKQPSCGVLLRVENPTEAAKWLKANLFFIDLPIADPSKIALQNGNCILYIEQGRSEKPPLPQKGAYFTGLAHVALRAADIDEAIRWCQSQELELQLDNGKSFFNPKVFGDGEQYFNIVSPFGVIFEVSCRLTGSAAPHAEVICGLDHLGIPCQNIEEELDYFAQCGFKPEFDIVCNHNDAEGTIYCDMVHDGEITLEIYQFADMKPVGIPKKAPIIGLWSAQKAGRSPSGVCIFN